MINQINEIKIKLNELKKIDKNYELFGSDFHKYRLNKKLSESELIKFEEKYGITLPNGYRLFLKLVGNGGAGSYYGINHLQESIPEYYMEDLNLLKDEFEFEEFWNGDRELIEILDILRGAGTNQLRDYYLNKFLMNSEYEFHEEEWKIIKLLSGNSGSKIERFFSDTYYNYYFSRDIDKGTLSICDYGCNLEFKLIVSGKEKGNIWFDKRADDLGLFPLRNEEKIKMDFLTWYLNWLNESLDQLKNK